MKSEGGARSPYLVGALISVLSMATCHLSDTRLGASRAYARAAGMLTRPISPRRARSRTGSVLGGCLPRWLLLAFVGLDALQVAAASLDADVRAGQRLATVATAGTACASCHGSRGEGMANFPRLAGLGATYLRGQLDSFATGARKNPIMQPIAQALTPQQRTQVAAYFSTLRFPATPQDRTAKAPSDGGAWLATRGRWDDAVPACAQCHGPGGVGVGEVFPPLAGQPAAYVADQLRAWQSGARPPGPLGLMETIARKLSATDIQAVSDYYAGLAAAAPPVAGASKVGAAGAKR